MKNYFKDYPRPQFIRENWENLNGEWDFAFDDENMGEKEKWWLPCNLQNKQKITVPFTYETKLSGIGDESIHNIVWYSKKITVKNLSKNVILNFEGSDYFTQLWVNGIFIGSHCGGYSRFSFDITNALTKEENIIVVRVTDSLDESQPRGKQRWINKNFGCWYVQTTGIWKTVWLEYAPKDKISSLKLTPNLETESIDIIADAISASGYSVKVSASFEGKFVNSAELPAKNGKISLSLNLHDTELDEWGIKCWSPESPNLYDLEVTLIKNGEVIDTVLSYFGMREIEIKGNQVLLNNKPLYQRLILDQGYWGDSHLTPPSEEALIEDIDKVMELGYNGVRKHMKLEDERFLLWSDIKGLLVWSEFPATYEYNDLAVERITIEWLEVVKQNYNHPSIITWTPFNESWGVPKIRTNKKQQDFTQGIYYLTKAIDSMRPVVCNDGWEHTISDIITLHDYEERGEDFSARYGERKNEILGNTLSHSGSQFAFAENFSYKGQPIIISEFGGIAFNNFGTGWGYGNKVETESAFIERFDSITTAVKGLDYCCGYCYTQVTDVQQEINGLMDINRNFKLPPETIKKINLK